MAFEHLTPEDQDALWRMIERSAGASGGSPRRGSGVASMDPGSDARRSVEFEPPAYALPPLPQRFGGARAIATAAAGWSITITLTAAALHLLEG
jgi:hypothetical protein